MDTANQASGIDIKSGNKLTRLDGIHISPTSVARVVNKCSDGPLLVRYRFKSAMHGFVISDINGIPAGSIANGTCHACNPIKGTGAKCYLVSSICEPLGKRKSIARSDAENCANFIHRLSFYVIFWPDVGVQ